MTKEIDVINDYDRGRRDCQRGVWLEGQSEEYNNGFGDEYAEAAGSDNKTEAMQIEEYLTR